MGRLLDRVWKWLGGELEPAPLPELESWRKIVLTIIGAICAAILIAVYQPTYCKHYKVEDFCSARSADYPLCLPGAEKAVRDGLSWCWEFVRKD